jgi:CDP-glycerol glycerophosphotransferase
VKVVYNSFDGRYSDNPRAVYEALVAADRPVTHLWLADPAHAHGFPAGTPTVEFGTPACLRALEEADVLVSNTHVELEWTKAPGARYLQTWHGTPLKHIHFDVLWAPPGRLDYLTHDVRRWDVLLSPNAASTGPLRQAFAFDKEVAETGYPRNDLLSSPDAGAVRTRVRADLGIDDAATVVLYTPTWRDDLLDAHGALDFSQQLDLDQFAERLGDDHVLLLRLHYKVTDRLGPLDRPGVLDVSYHPDINELYLAADVLVTDYSSTMFDFAVTGRPIVFFTYDLEDYRDRLRGFYFDFEEIAPGPLLATTAEVVEALAGLHRVREQYRGAYARFQQQFCHLDDGRAAGRVLERYFPVDGGVPRPLADTTREA